MLGATAIFPLYLGNVSYETLPEHAKKKALEEQELTCALEYKFVFLVRAINEFKNIIRKFAYWSINRELFKDAV